MELKNYDPNDRWGTHTIKVTFQMWKYKGYLTYQTGGNCRGLGVFENFDTDSLWEHSFKDNPIKFKLLSDDWCAMTLTDDEGNELEGEYEYSDLEGMIVGIEIINFVKEQANENR